MRCRVAAVPFDLQRLEVTADRSRLSKGSVEATSTGVAHSPSPTLIADLHSRPDYCATSPQLNIALMIKKGR
jgi:hypothetical protein